MKRGLLCTAILSTIPATTQGGAIVYHQVAGFVSDVQPNVTLTFPTFDTQNGSLILTDVRVDVRHRAGVMLRADNDDPFKAAQANGRMIRTWLLTAPDVVAFGNKTVATATVNLDKDDGDGGAFDSSAPDGTDFGLIQYDEVNGSFHPNQSAYETNGVGSVDFTADVLLMVNDLQFTITPDVWQLEVQRPYLDIDVTLTYNYTIIPLPPAVWLGLIGLAGAAWIVRRVR